MPASEGWPSTTRGLGIAVSSPAGPEAFGETEAFLESK